MGVVCLVLLALILAEWTAIVAWGDGRRGARRAPHGGWRRSLCSGSPPSTRAPSCTRAFPGTSSAMRSTGSRSGCRRHPSGASTEWDARRGRLRALARGVVAARACVPSAAAARCARRRVVGRSRLSRPQPPRPEVPVALAPAQPHGGDRARRRREPPPAIAAPRAGPRSGGPAADADRDPGVRAAGLLAAQPTPAAGPRERSPGAALQILFNDVEEEADGRYYNAARLLEPGASRARRTARSTWCLSASTSRCRGSFSSSARSRRRSGPLLPRPQPTLSAVGAAGDRHGDLLRDHLPVARAAGDRRRREPARYDFERLLVRARWRSGAALRRRGAARGRERSIARPGRDHRDLRNRGRPRAHPRETRPNERVLVRGDVRLETGSTAWTRWGCRLPPRRRRGGRSPC